MRVSTNIISHLSGNLNFISGVAEMEMVISVIMSASCLDKQNDERKKSARCSTVWEMKLMKYVPQPLLPEKRRNSMTSSHESREFSRFAEIYFMSKLSSTRGIRKMVKTWKPVLPSYRIM